MHPDLAPRPLLNDPYTFSVALRRRRGSARHRLALEGLRSGSELIRSESAAALDERGAAELVAPLLRALKDRSPLVRSSAAESLGFVGDHRAARPLGKALADPSPLVRGSAALAPGVLKRGRRLIRKQLDAERRSHARLC